MLKRGITETIRRTAIKNQKNLTVYKQHRKYNKLCYSHTLHTHTHTPPYFIVVYVSRESEGGE